MQKNKPDPETVLRVLLQILRDRYQVEIVADLTERPAHEERLFFCDERCNF